MTSWSPAVRKGALALTLGGVLTGCHDGNQAVRLFFGTSNIGSCDSMTVEVDLQTAEAALAHQADGTVDCALDALLAGSGCDVIFSEMNDDRVLRVTISGCEIPAVTSLFQCGFTTGSISALEEATGTECTCAHPPACIYQWGCDTAPPVCINQNEDPGSCENCDNGTDDDQDGLIDCADPQCAHTASCGWGQTTATCPSTTTPTSTSTTLPATTTTLVNPTTTITLDGHQDYTVLFRLDTAGAGVGALQWTVDYATAAGQFQGSGASVVCSNKVAGALFAPNDADADRRLTLGLIALTPFTAPTDLVQCTFNPVSPGPPVPGDFAVTIDDAADADGNPITVTIAVVTVPIP